MRLREKMTTYRFVSPLLSALPLETSPSRRTRERGVREEKNNTICTSSLSSPLYCVYTNRNSSTSSHTAQCPCPTNRLSNPGVTIPANTNANLPLCPTVFSLASPNPSASASATCAA